MTVKEKRGRRRYVYFVSVSGESVPREDLVRTVIAPCEKAPLRSFKMIQFDGRTGIARSSLKELEALKAIINKDGGSLFRTVRTSGTIKSLRDRYYANVEPCGTEEQG